MAYYPIAVDITDKNVLVVGGGVVAQRKIETLIEFGASVRVVSPEVTADIENLSNSGAISLIRRGYESGDLADVSLVVAATDDRIINSKVSEDARALGILINVVDDPELCTFIVQSVVKRGDLTISIGTGGRSPALSKHVRKKIEETFGPEYGELAELLGELRDKAKLSIPSQKQREQVFKEILASGVLDLLKNGKKDEAWTLAREIMDSAR
jgi:precorrin-2 dehydrogenase / sirohydrochlorin ferrochelatase